ncbi:MAG: hypothetical protein H6Q74_1600 [Firmicutes bacterium]|nr:hypothetical protein [Bacillota bacterium]
MTYVLAGLMATLSFLLNRVALRYIGINAVITCGPVLEECAKTLLAYYLGADIFYTHVLFGAIEAGYDLVTSKHRLVAALISIGGHSLFGLVTIMVLSVVANIVVALISAAILHVAGNITVIMLSHRKDDV